LSSSNSGPWDPGLDGNPNVLDAQFRLVFRATGIGRAVVHIGTGYPGDGEVGPGGTLDTSADTPIEIHVIPEPASAVSMLLGLAGLALRGRTPHLHANADAR
jgi:hypothetical protein